MDIKNLIKVPCVIKSIELLEDIYPNTNSSGYVLTVDDGLDIGTIKLGISNDQCCCEEWGYITTPDDVSEFIGSEVLDINLVSQMQRPDGDCAGTMFINIETDNGLLQLSVYNNHNGYYGHVVEVSVNYGNKTDKFSDVL